MENEDSVDEEDDITGMKCRISYTQVCQLSDLANDLIISKWSNRSINKKMLNLFDNNAMQCTEEF